jgi:hypothetical protein
MLVVRPSWAKATVYLGSNQASIGASCNPADLEVCANEDYPLDVDVYFIRSCTTLGTCESPNVPALYRLVLGSDATVAMTPQLIASGIESMQIQYGVPEAGGGGGIDYVDAPTVEAADPNPAAPPCRTWRCVVAVKIWLLARSTDAEYSGFKNKTAYVVGDQTVKPGGADGSGNPIGDNFVRQLYTTVVQLRK